MKREDAHEYTEALGQVIGGAVRLADLAQTMGVPAALGLTSEEWQQRRLAGAVHLSREERRKVSPELAEDGWSTRQIGEALGVSHETIAEDLRVVRNLTEPVRNLTQPVLELQPEPQGRDRTVMFTSETDEWATPQALFDLLDREFGFDLDVCATSENAKCERHFTREQDGLSQRWDGTAWMNPPYGQNIGDWVAKAASSAQEGATVVTLLPARVDTAWWWDHCRYGEIRFLRGRLRFGGGEFPAPFPSAVVVFGRSPAVKWWEAWPE